MTARIIVASALVAIAVTGCAKVQTAPPAPVPDAVPAPAPVDVKAIEEAAHGAYLAAINSNNLETLMADLTTDVVYQSPNETELVGKDAVRKWAAAYIAAYKFKWEKTSIGFTVSGDWAFERYSYKVLNTDRQTGALYTDVGKGVNIYHHDADGKWRVAIDGWSSSLPASK